MIALAANGVCRRYGKQEVLRGLDLSVACGSFEALMGPSGCGKSTFLHLAAGLLAADAGSIVVGGTEVTALSDAAATRFRRRHVGVVFQAFNLLGEKNVRENILLPLYLDGVAESQPVTARLEMLAAKMDLTDKLQKHPDELSGGEQQRVAIARALIAEPDVVLADEPTGNLDAVSAHEVCRLLKEVSSTVRGALLVVTHDPMVAACAQKVHFLKDGKIAASHETKGDAALVSRLYLETYR